MERLLRGCEDVIVLHAAAAAYRGEHRSWARKIRSSRTHGAEPDGTGERVERPAWLRIGAVAEAAVSSPARPIPLAWIGLRMVRSAAAARGIWMCASIVEE